MPDLPVNIVIDVGVSYDSDTRRVQEVLADEARLLSSDLPGLVRDFEPIVRFQSFGDLSLNFLVILRVETYDAQFPIWGEIHHRIFARLQREGIEIPFPVRTVHLRGAAAVTPAPAPVGPGPADTSGRSGREEGHGGAG
jgi:small-conductance mechanosensitive channel